MKGSQIVDVSLTPKSKSTGHISSVVGIEGGVMLDYDHATATLYWVQGNKEDEENESNTGNVSSPSFSLQLSTLTNLHD